MARSIPTTVAALCLLLVCPAWAETGDAATAPPVGDRTVLEWAQARGDGYDVRGEVVGGTQFLLQPRGPGRTDITVYRGGVKRLRMPDIPVRLPNGEFYPPGMTYKAYDFSLSPDQKFLFVVRGLIHDESVGYLYRRAGTSRMRPVRPSGLRFDEAALRDYAHRRHISLRKFGSYARVIHLVKWEVRAERLVFTMSAATFWTGGAPRKGDFDATWTGWYDLQRNTFGLTHL